MLLFDIGSSYHRLNEWKADLWEKFQIPAPESDKETNDAIVFGYLVAWFLGEVCIYYFETRQSGPLMGHHPPPPPLNPLVYSPGLEKLRDCPLS